jgi:lysophospholipase L1-like esterase
VVIIGDSTVQTYDLSKTIRGWGQQIGILFNDKVKVTNLALAGRSTKTFINQGLWDKALTKITPGTFVLIQFGHNDSHRKGRPESTDVC